MNTYNIIYRFQLSENQTETIGLRMDESTLLLLDSDAPAPAWAQLEYKQCSHCPLKKQQHPTCPIARHLSRYTPIFDKVRSFDKVKLLVKMPERTITQTTSAQKAISGMVGYIMAASGCPHTAYFRPMARYHLPLANEQETAYRATSMYLLGQYFKDRAGEKPDWSIRGLRKIYQQVGIVNQSIGARLREATKSDSSVNAIVNLDMYAKVVPDMVEESLFEMQHLFSAYFENNSDNLDFTF